MWAKQLLSQSTWLDVIMHITIAIITTCNKHYSTEWSDLMTGSSAKCVGHMSKLIGNWPMSARYFENCQCYPQNQCCSCQSIHISTHTHMCLFMCVFMCVYVFMCCFHGCSLDSVCADHVTHTNTHTHKHIHSQPIPSIATQRLTVHVVYTPPTSIYTRKYCLRSINTSKSKLWIVNVFTCIIIFVSICFWSYHIILIM